MHGNQVGERQCGPCPTTKVICNWRRQRVTEVGKEQMYFVHVLVKWSNLEAEAKNWMTDNGQTRISLSTQMFLCEVRRWTVAYCATVCGWTVC
jgi:hypothetical protein